MDKWYSKVFYKRDGFRPVWTFIKSSLSHNETAEGNRRRGNTELPIQPNTTCPTRLQMRPAKTQLMQADQSLCRALEDGFVPHSELSEDSNLTARISRLIWVFAGCSCNIVGNAVPRLHLYCRIRYLYKSPRTQTWKSITSSVFGHLCYSKHVIF